MRHNRLRRSLQVFLTILGLVAIAAGLSTALFGATTVAGVDEASPAVDSEMRFFAVWYAAAGAALLRAIPRIEARAALIRGVGVAFFIAGCARLLSWVGVGRPPTVAVVLMVIELALPFIVIPWHVAVARRAHRRVRGTTGF